MFHVEQSALLRCSRRFDATIAALISLTAYVSLLAKCEVRLTFLASVVGRLPIGVTGLAMLILVQSSRAPSAKAGPRLGYLAGLAAIAPGWVAMA